MAVARKFLTNTGELSNFPITRKLAVNLTRIHLAILTTANLGFATTCAMDKGRPGAMFGFRLAGVRLDPRL